MAKLTRRGLIKGASVGVGATGALAAAVITGIHFGSTTSTNTSAPGLPLKASTEPLVVCINDPASGNLVLMRGETQFTVHDPALVRSFLSF